MRLWRIANYADLSGQGGKFSAGRWNFLGTPMVYCADHPATALVEILVHVDAEDLPLTYQLLEIEVPDKAKPAVPTLSSNWQDDLNETRQIGTNFIAAGNTPVLEVPTVVVPFARNYLLNPMLLDQHGIRVAGVTTHPFDARLLG
ncbi:RES family NAD+ phosphorylase [Aminobacter sp. Piv2-1]|uniref:RES family NAD+ phosphorylase n=1 Tax=Aminobacter sp. Piv2-1 TaxID=3031122 RepID=UPI0030AE17EC